MNLRRSSESWPGSRSRTKYPPKTNLRPKNSFRSQCFSARDARMSIGEIVSREECSRDYYYLSSVNAGLVRHFETLARKLAGAQFVVDIGSNDGILLKPLKTCASRLSASSPRSTFRKSPMSGMTTLCTFFDAAIAEKLEADYGKPDVIVASSVLRHLGEPGSIYRAISSCCRPRSIYH